MVGVPFFKRFMSKRPSFQFYPADWRNNAKLRRCSWAARGAWVEVMGLLHDSDFYGVLRWNLKEIALAIGCPVSLIKELVEKGVLKGCDKGKSEVLSYTPSSGRQKGPTVTLLNEEQGPIWFSSRMVRDEYVRQNRGKGTRFEPENTPSYTTSNHSPIPPFGEYDSDSLKHSPSRCQSDGSTSTSSSSINTNSTATELEVLETADFRAALPDESKKPEKPPSRNIKISMLLRSLGVKPMTGQHPFCIELAANPKATDAVLKAAVEHARQQKGDDADIHPNYLAKILPDYLDPKPEKKKEASWWTSSEGIDRKARELGMQARPAESYPEFTNRLHDEIRKRKAMP